MTARSAHKRLERLRQRLEAQQANRLEQPASVRWLGLLEFCLPYLEDDAEATVVAARVRDSIELLRAYVTEVHSPMRAWPLVEDFCLGCLYRLQYTDPGWQGRTCAFLDDDYAEQLRDRAGIDRWRSGPLAEPTGRER